MEIYQVSEHINGVYQENLKMLKDIGLKTSVVFNPCRSVDPIETAKTFAKKISKEYFDTLYIGTGSIENFDQNCKWPNYSAYQNCRYVEKLISQFQKEGFKVGMALD